MPTMLERAQAKHKAALDDVTKLRDKRDKAIDVLMRTEVKYRKAVSLVGRSQKRLTKMREEERKAKLTVKKAVAESKQELPSIVI